MERLLIGRKAICAYLDLSWSTVLKWKRRFGLPVVQVEGMAPTLHTAHLEAWQRERLERQGKKRPHAL